MSELMQDTPLKDTPSTQTFILQKKTNPARTYPHPTLTQTMPEPTLYGSTYAVVSRVRVHSSLSTLIPSATLQPLSIRQKKYSDFEIGVNDCLR